MHKPLNLRAILVVLVTTCIVTMCVLEFFVRFDRQGEANALTAPRDFRAFYCGARALAAHADPYREEPLMSCENHAADLYRVQHEEVPLASPLPPYALAMLGPIAGMPFGTAAKVWTLFTFTSFAAATALLVRLTRLSVAAVAGAMLFSSFVPSILQGQFGPTLIVLICLLAIAVRRLDSRLAVVCLVGLACEPHVALPIFVSLFVLRSSSRPPVAIAVLILAAMTVVTGLPLIREYLFEVLPSHAASQLANFQQYSLTNLLWSLGFPGHLALAYGALSYLAIIVMAIFLAYRLLRITNDPAYVILVPAALSVVGGPYIHITQIAIALPLALLIVTRWRRVRTPMIFAIVILALPLQPLMLWSQTMDGFVGQVRYAVPEPRRNEVSNQIVESQFDRHYVDTVQPGSGSATSLIPKIPTWFALLILLVSLAAIASTPSEMTRAPETSDGPRPKRTLPEWRRERDMRTSILL